MGSYRTYSSLVKQQPWFLSLRWKACLWAELQPWCLNLQLKTCPLAEHSDDDTVVNLVPCCNPKGLSSSDMVATLFSEWSKGLAIWKIHYRIDRDIKPGVEVRQLNQKILACYFFIKISSTRVQHKVGSMDEMRLTPYIVGQWIARVTADHACRTITRADEMKRNVWDECGEMVEWNLW